MSARTHASTTGVGAARTWLRWTIIAAIVGLFWCPAAVNAGSAYSRGGYGACPYTQACPTPPAATQATLPSGLEIAINLTDDQVIPISGYTVTVTPLNGQGATFDHVDFFVDGQLVDTEQPGSDGTAHWFWDPARFPGTTVQVTVTGSDGHVLTKEFHVQISQAPAPSGPTKTPTPQTNGGNGSTANQAPGVIEKFLAGLPAPVIVAFPYLLFVILVINLYLLVQHMRREVRAYRQAAALLARARRLAASKNTFLELAAHYLRTPLTIILGGIDMLGMSTSGTPPDTVNRLRTIGNQLKTQIELLISEISAVETPVDTLPGSNATHLPGASFWRRPGLLVPLILIGFIVAGFDYLAAHANVFVGSTLDLAVQVVVFISIALLTYFVFRRMQLKSRDAAELTRTLEAENADRQARDELVTGATTTLGGGMQQLKQAIAGLPASKALEFITNGLGQFYHLLTVFRTASTLKDSRSTDAYTTTPFNELLRAAATNVAPKAAARGISLPAGINAEVPTANPALLTVVLASVLDNAVAYSADRASIEATCVTGDTGVTITITDHGSGIPAEKLAAIAEPFNRAEGAEDFTHAGMGFSLYLDTLIMQYLGGTIAVDSMVGKGTTVTLHLPM